MYLWQGVGKNLLDFQVAQAKSNHRRAGAFGGKARIFEEAQLLPPCGSSGDACCTIVQEMEDSIGFLQGSWCIINNARRLSKGFQRGKCILWLAIISQWWMHIFSSMMPGSVNHIRRFGRILLISAGMILLFIQQRSWKQGRIEEGNFFDVIFVVKV